MFLIIKRTKVIRNQNWFDVDGKVITTRKINTLNYKQAKKVAKDDYGIKAKTIELGYGYNNPCYVITSDVSQILLDYDSYQRVYQRGVKYDG